MTRDALSILLITGEYPPAIGGVGDYTSQLGNSLVAMGHSVTVLTSAEPNALGSAPLEGPLIGPFPTPSVGVIRGIANWGPRAAAKIADAAAATGADIVHLQYQTAAYQLSPAINALPALLRRRRVRAGFVTTFHDLRGPYLFPKAGRLRGLAVHALVGLSDTSVFTDPSDLARAHPRGDAAWIPIAPNLVSSTRPNREEERVRLGIREGERVLAHFGFLNATKGVEVLFRAAHRLVQGGAELRLLLIGDAVGSSDPTNAATAQSLQTLAESLGIANRIIRTGFLPPSGVTAAIAAADVAGLPFSDGASLRRGSLLTCLAHGLPVVTTRPQPSPNVPERFRVPPFTAPDSYAITERAVALVPPSDDTALAEEIRRLLEDPPHRASLVKGGLALAAGLSWPNVARATATVYRRTLAKLCVESRGVEEWRATRGPA